MTIERSPQFLNVHDVVAKYDKADVASPEEGRPSRQRDWLDLIETRMDYNPQYTSHMVADVSRHGVREPIGIDTSTTPPTVSDGHNRLLAAYLTGMRRIPAVERPVGQAERKHDERYWDTIEKTPGQVR